MKISRLGAHVVALSVAAAAFAGCGGSQSAVPQAAVTAFAPQTAAPAFRRKGECRGTHGVRVNPCPVNLTAKRINGVTVTVSGPGVVNSSEGYNGCAYDDYCAVQQINDTQYLITPGKKCGTVLLEFDGNDASGQNVGLAFLTVRNKYCP